MKKILLFLIFVIALPGLVLAYNSFKKGNEFYLNGDYSAALEEYSKFTQKKKNKYEGFFNAGNANYRLEQYDKAIEMYGQALKLKPDDEDTKYNIEEAKKKLEEQKKDPQQKKQDDKQNQKQEQKQDQKQDGKDGKGQDKKDKNGQGKDEKDGSKGKDEGKGEEKEGQGQQGASQPKPDPGMSEDEMQAMLNNMKKGEQQYKGYFGKQQQRQPKVDAFGMPDLFNMSPEEVQQYMMNRMNGNFQQPKKGGNEKDW